MHENRYCQDRYPLDRRQGVLIPNGGGPKRHYESLPYQSLHANFWAVRTPIRRKL